jgi:hypothetical protein
MSFSDLLGVVASSPASAGWMHWRFVTGSETVSAVSSPWPSRARALLGDVFGEIKSTTSVCGAWLDGLASSFSAEDAGPAAGARSGLFAVLSPSVSIFSAPPTSFFGGESSVLAFLEIGTCVRLCGRTSCHAQCTLCLQQGRDTAAFRCTERQRPRALARPLHMLRDQHAMSRAGAPHRRARTQRATP